MERLETFGKSGRCFHREGFMFHRYEPWYSVAIDLEVPAEKQHLYSHPLLIELIIIVFSTTPRLQLPMRPAAHYDPPARQSIWSVEARPMRSARVAR